jgi:hypothetical protein
MSKHSLMKTEPRFEQLDARYLRYARLKELQAIAHTDALKKRSGFFKYLGDVPRSPHLPLTVDQLAAASVARWDRFRTKISECRSTDPREGWRVVFAYHIVDEMNTYYNIYAQMLGIERNVKNMRVMGERLMRQSARFIELALAEIEIETIDQFEELFHVPGLIPGAREPDAPLDTTLMTVLIADGADQIEAFNALAASLLPQRIDDSPLR